MRYERLGGEQTSEQRLRELQFLAAAQPVADVQVRSGRERHAQFAGEYHRRFPEIKRVREDEATDAEIFYVRMVKERFGYDLMQFYEENLELCEAICATVAAKEPYDTLVLGHGMLSAAEAEGQAAPGSAQSLHDSVNHPMGIEAVGIYYWDQINPLLKQAYSLMDQQMLNAPFLTK